jgi:hypothetical protein
MTAETKDISKFPVVASPRGMNCMPDHGVRPTFTRWGLRTRVFETTEWVHLWRATGMGPVLLERTGRPAEQRMLEYRVGSAEPPLSEVGCR